MSQIIKVDLHCHTVTSKDSYIFLDDLLKECDRKGIQKVAITDHNNINGALEAKTHWPERIISGLEIMTSRGELIAYYVNEPVASGLTPIETIQALKAQKALISVSHPFDRWRNGGWKTPWLLEILPYLDAIETFNAHCLNDKPNQIAEAFANDHQLPSTAGSDAHFIHEVGMAGLTLVNFNNASELCESLRSAKVFGRRTPLTNRIVNRLKRITHPRS